MSFPASAVFQQDQWSLAGSDLSIGTSIGGRTQYAANIDPLWVANYVFRVFPAGYLEWEAWRERRRGRLRSAVIVPDCGRMHITQGESTTDDLVFTNDLPGGDNADVYFTNDLPGGDGAAVSFELGQTDGLTGLTLTAAALQFSSQIEVSEPTRLSLGRFIWIDARMYRVSEIINSTVYIDPPLKAPAASGTAIQGMGFINMVLSGQEDGLLQRGLTGFADVSVTMVEER